MSESRSVTLSGGFRVPAAVDEAFELFSPEGERRWVPGWNPETIGPPGAGWQEGLVFRTRDERGEVLWVVSRLDRRLCEVEYYRFQTQRHMARVQVRCSAAAGDAGETEVRVSYTFVGLSAPGNEAVAAMTPASFEERLERWRIWIGQLLAAGAEAGREREAKPLVETARLVLRRLSLDDAPFVLELLNQPSFLRFIGDKGVRDLEGAREYLRKGPLDSYARLGHGLYLTLLKESGTPIGLCGLLKREALPDPDIGFAFLPEHWGQGYAFEAAAAVLDFETRRLGLERVVAITTPDNHASIRLLEKLGLSHERMVRLSEDAAELRLYATGA